MSGSVLCNLDPDEIEKCRNELEELKNKYVRANINRF